MANTFLGMDVSGLLNNLGGEGLTTEERKRAVAFGLLNLGAGTLANNTGNYGQFGPAFGKGMTQGLLGYQAQLGREEAGAKQRRQAKLLSDAFNSSMSQETIPGQVQETQGYDVGGNFSQDMPTAQFMADQGKDINNLMMMQPSKQPKPLETFGLGFPNPPIGQQLPGSRMPFNPNRTQGKPITAPPEPMTEAERELLNMQLAPEGQFDFQKQGGMLTTGSNGSYELPTSYAQGPERWINPADVQAENVVPKTYKTKQPDTLGREQFDMLKAARALMKSGDPQLMQQGFEIYSSLKTPDAVKPQLVERWNPATKQVEKVWMTPGSAEGVLAGLAKPEAIDYNKPFLPDGTPNLNYQDYSKDKAKAGATNVSVGPTRVENISTQESEGSKVYGKGLGEMQVQIQKQGFTAPSKIANLERMAQLLDGVDSGKFSGLGLEASRFAKSLGLNVDPKLGNKQAAEALAIEMALQMREPGSGPMTDRDFENYLNTVPNLAKTAEGRKEITATLKAKARRDLEIAKMTREYAKKNRGVIDDNFLDQIAEYMAANPVVHIARDYGDGWKMRVK